MLSHFLRMRVPILSALLLLTACATASSESNVGSSTSNQTEAHRPLETIKGREWARCWFVEQAADQASLRCTSTARGNDPLPATVEVVALTSRDSVPRQKTLDIEAGAIETIAFSIPRTSFPVVLFLRAKLGDAAGSIVGLSNGFELALHPTVAAPTEVTAARPLILAQPFDLWPAAFIDARSGGVVPGAFQIDTKPYTQSIEPYDFFGERALTYQKSFVAFDNIGKLTYFVTPKAPANTIAMTVDTFNDRPLREVPLTGPGYYAIGNDGAMTPASAELVARDFPR